MARKLQLTDRQVLFFKDFREGKTLRNIAKKHNIAPGTLEHYLTKAYIKLGVENLAAALRKAEELHLLGKRYKKFPWSKLSDMQLRIADLVAEGKTNQEISTEVGLSVGGVIYHLGRIYKMFKIYSREQLAAGVGRRK